EFNKNLRSYLLNSKDYQEVREKQFFGQFVQSIRIQPILQDFRLEKYYLYFLASDFNEIVPELLLINSFVSVRFNSTRFDTYSFLIKYIFPLDTPNKAYLNWQLFSKKNLNEYCLFSIKKRHEILYFSKNIAPDGWRIDYNTFMQHVQKVLFDPTFNPYNPNIKTVNFQKTQVDSYISPNDPKFKDLLSIFDKKSTIKSFWGTKKGAQSELVVTRLLQNKLIHPTLKFKNLKLRIVSKTLDSLRGPLSFLMYTIGIVIIIEILNIPQIAKINSDPENYEITLYDDLDRNNILSFNTDLVVLSTPMVPPADIKSLSSTLNIPLDENGFFIEAHTKLRPLDFAGHGIFVCGCASWPKNVQDSILESNGAAGRASRFLSIKEISTSKLEFLSFLLSIECFFKDMKITTEKCNGCGICRDICAFKAISLVDMNQEFEDVSIPEILEVQLINQVVPTMFVSKLKKLLLKSPKMDKYIVNVSSAEGQFSLSKDGRHPHTCIAKAALNMLT
ncbi:MAG: hypothetical protein KGD73_08110, partial [Candidatus Lokiarchaeota archaeon]|nr:hypothetical protein [Candidatus Lokiarchaeota archaeon]